MEMLFLIGILILNFVISAWNSYATGRAWGEVGDGWMKVVLYSGLGMAICGFLSVTSIVCGFIALSAGYLDQRAMQAMFSLMYLTIIFPILGFGLVLTIESWIRAYKERDFASMGVAAWNTFAQGKNMYDAANGGVSNAFGVVSSFFSSKDNDDDAKTMAAKAAVIVVLIAASAMAGGLTYVFFRMGRKNSVLNYAAQSRQPAYR